MSCCVCLEDTDDCYGCFVCKEGNLCWDCWDRIYVDCGWQDSIYTPCPICKSNMNWMFIYLDLCALFEDSDEIGDRWHAAPVFKKLLDWMEKGLLD